MKQFHPSEKGQIVVFLALAVLGLLGLTALAIDGGMIYADQRYSQSSADAASLAGGGAVAQGINDLGMYEEVWDCSRLTTAISNGYVAAIAKAASNGYEIGINANLGSNENNKHGVKITCSTSGEYVDVDVMLTKTTKTSFVQLFNNKEMKTTVFSKTRAKPRKIGTGGASIVSLAHLGDGVTDDCGSKQGGVWFSGTNKSTLISGGVYSNSCVDKNSGASTVSMTDASVTYHATSYSAGITDPMPKPDPNYHPLTYEKLPFPNEEYCTRTDAANPLPYYGDAFFASGGERTISPGRYRNWDFKVPVKLNPGLYCISGSVSMNSSAWVYTPEAYDADGHRLGVTIYFSGTSMTLNGGANTVLNAPNGFTDYTDPDLHYAVNNLLVYIPPGKDADVTINGNANNTLAGTLYMPDSNVKINGAAGVGTYSTLECSIIGYWVTITGASDMKIIYNDKQQTSWPSYIQLQK